MSGACGLEQRLSRKRVAGSDFAMTIMRAPGGYIWEVAVHP